MYEILNKTFGELKFDNIVVGARTSKAITKEDYKRLSQDITYAEVHNWCRVTEIQELKEEKKEIKKKSE